DGKTSRMHRRWVVRRRHAGPAWRPGPVALLDAPDLGLGVVAVDPHPPHAQHAGLDAHLRAGPAHARQGRRIGLLPDLAVVERVALAVAEAVELAGDAGLDRFLGAEVEEAAVLLHHFVAAFLARLLD